MAKDTTISVAGRNAAIDPLMVLLNGGTLEIRTGAKPATPETAASGTLLTTHALAATFAGAASSGSATANAIGNGTAAAGGTAGYGRFKTSGGTAVMDVIVGGTAEGDSAGTVNILLTTKVIVVGDVVSVTAFTYSMPASSAL